MADELADIAWVVHRAGPMTAEGLQSCTRCTLVLNDLSNAGVDLRPSTGLAWVSGTPIARLDGDAIVNVPHTGPLLPDMALCQAIAS